MLVSVAGLLLIARADAASGLAAVVAGFAVSNLGAGPMVTLGTDFVVGSAPLEKAGSAAAMNETSGEFGFALGIAALGSLGTIVYRGRLGVPAGVPDGDARETLAGAAEVAGRLPGRTGAALLGAARDAFTGGMHVAAGVSAALLVAVAVLVAALLRDVRPDEDAKDVKDAAGVPELEKV
jgi:DHA2 family multidrug resistance protein-like MFS transporter